MQITKWYKRLFNLIIDFFTIEFITMIVLLILKSIGVNIEQKVMLSDKVEFYTTSFLTFLFTFLIYYYIFEFFTGKTLGKIITKSKINIDNNKNRIVIILYRTLSRLLIFEIFWFFKNKPVGLHDRLSSTTVIDDSN